MESSALTIKPGYKRTDIGIIPDDWEVKQLCQLFEITSSKRVFQSEWKSKGVPFYRARELAVLGEQGSINNELFISREMYENYKRVYGVPKPKDMLVTGVGTLGKTYVVENNHEFYFKDGNIIWFKIDGKINSNYLRQLYLTPLIKKQIEDASAGTTVGTYTITGANKTKIPLPPPPEQQAIAKVLSDADSLITSLDQLIIKKRNIQQGTMQLLLTGKKRLAGFSGDWKTKTLDEVAEIDTDNLRSNTSPNYTFQYISLEDVETGLLKNTTECVFRFAPSRARRKIQKNDILVSTVRPNLKSHLYIEKEVKDFICSTGFSVIRCNEKIVSARYIYNHFFGDTVEKQINLLLVGSNYPAINSKDIKNLRIPIPTIEEQQAVAQVLSDMNAEVEGLEAKRDKYKAIKQGMMQELLTGRTRLV